MDQVKTGLVGKADLDELESWETARAFLQAASMAEALAGTQVTQATRAAEVHLGVSVSREWVEAVVLRRAAWRVLAKKAHLVHPRVDGS